MSKLEVDAIEPQSGTTLTLGASGDTITIPSGATLSNSGTLGSGMGKVLQVVSTTKTDTYSETISTRGIGSDITGLTATITPTSASSKLLVYATLNTSRSGNYSYANFIIYRDGSSVLVGDSAGSRLPVTVGDNLGVLNGINMFNTFSFGQVNAGSTSSTTFSLRLENSGSGASQTFYVNRSATDTDSNGFTRAISSIMVMEVSA